MSVSDRSGQGSFAGKLLALFRPGSAPIDPSDTRRRSWARRVKSCEELPERYRSFFNTARGTYEDGFPYSVLTPTFAGIQRRPEREKLISLIGDNATILEHEGGELVVNSYPLGGRCCVEHSVILLHSSITIRGPGSGCGVRTACLKFNTVTDHLMAPIIERLRSPTSRAATDLNRERKRFDFLARTHFRFYSRGRASIRPGASALQILLQPEIRRGHSKLLGPSLSRRIFPAHLAILTDTELILIRDDHTQFWLRRAPHGAIWSYIPRNMIAGAWLSAGEHELLTLSIDLCEDLALSTLYDFQARSGLESLLQELQSSQSTRI